MGNWTSSSSTVVEPVAPTTSRQEVPTNMQDVKQADSLVESPTPGLSNKEFYNLLGERPRELIREFLETKTAIEQVQKTSIEMDQKHQPTQMDMKTQDKIKAGETVLVIGRSQSGKTRFINDLYRRLAFDDTQTVWIIEDYIGDPNGLFELHNLAFKQGAILIISVQNRLHVNSHFFESVQWLVVTSPLLDYTGLLESHRNSIEQVIFGNPLLIRL
jgi:hypothetical protein